MAALLRAVVSMAADSPRSDGVALRLTVEAADTEAKASAYVVLGHDFAARAGGHQSDRQRLLVLAAGRRGANRAAAGRAARRRRRASPRATRSSSRSTTTARASRRTRSSASSSASTPIARTQGFGQNSGLGLSISRQIVQAHGGRIWASNRPASAETAATNRRRATSRRRAPRRGRALRHLPAGDRAVTTRRRRRLVEPARDARSSSARAALWCAALPGRARAPSRWR